MKLPGWLSTAFSIVVFVIVALPIIGIVIAFVADKIKQLCNPPGLEYLKYMKWCPWCHRPLEFDQDAYKLSGQTRRAEVKCRHCGQWVSVTQKLGKWEAQLARIDEELKESPDSHELWWQKGMVLHMAERYNESRECFEKSARLGGIPLGIVVETLRQGKKKGGREKQWFDKR